jgi:hypothetical protein
MSYSARFPIAADDLDSTLIALLGQPWRIITTDDGPHDTKTAAPINDDRGCRLSRESYLTCERRLSTDRAERVHLAVAVE